MSKEFKNLINQKLSTDTTELTEAYNNTSDEYRNWVSLDSFLFFFSEDRSSFLWEDYETWGSNPQLDETSQYACIRTTSKLDIIDIPLNIYCKPTMHRIPHPMAVEVTKLSPFTCIEKGLPEYEFAKIIYAEKSIPRTCSSAYNGIRFDREVSRYLFHKNLFPQYSTEYANGNSVWDIQMTTALFRAIRPDGINWPKNSEGKPSIRLEDLCKANNIVQEHAHDALSDVFGLIGLAKLLKSNQPKLWDYMFKIKSKKVLNSEIKLNEKIYCYTNMTFGMENLYTKPILPLFKLTTENDAIIAVDLTVPTDEFKNLTADELKERIYMKKAELEELGVKRPPFIKIKLNKCPAIVPSSVFDETVMERLNLSQNFILKNANALYNNTDLINKIKKAFSTQTENEQPEFPEHQLYGFDFYSKKDMAQINRIHDDGVEFTIEKLITWDDPRPQELVKRILKINFPEKLPEMFQEELELKRVNNLSYKNEVTLDNYEELASEMIQSKELRQDYINFVKTLIN